MSTIKATQTIVYKKVGDLEIAFDLYLPENAKNVPVLLWFHGGGCLQGHREQLAPWMRKGVTKYNYACISADYRLCPQVGIADILQDVQDIVAFIRTQLASHVPQGSVDTTRLAVSGSSAGGYLTLLAGLYISPKPQVILPIYPITDPLGWFFTNPQPPPMKRPLLSHAELGSHLDPNAPVQANSNPDLTKEIRGHMYVRMLADANLAKLWHVPENAGVETNRWRLSRAVYDHRTPPTYLIHGDADTAVGIEQGDEVVGAMVGCGIEVVYERPHGKDHFLDAGDVYENDAFFQFMMKHV